MATTSERPPQFGLISMPGACLPQPAVNEISFTSPQGMPFKLKQNQKTKKKKNKKQKKKKKKKQKTDVLPGLQPERGARGRDSNGI